MGASTFLRARLIGCSALGASSAVSAKAPVSGSRLSVRSSGNFRFSTDKDLHSNTGMAKHGDQRIDAESVDFPSDEVADPRLGHAKQTRRLSLREPSRLDQLAEANHQICADLEILRLLSYNQRWAR